MRLPILRWKVVANSPRFRRSILWGRGTFDHPVNGSLSFLAADGVVRTYAIESVSAILNSDGEPSDLCFGTLETKVASGDGINFQPFLSLPEAAFLIRS